jgi:calcineurin-like phosphoesterase family protein
MKPNWLFTADLHLDHDGILKWADRPFTSMMEMNSALMRGWNETAGPGDIVVCAGDFAWAARSDYVKHTFVDRLHGNKIFLKGNHDFWIRKSETRHLYIKRIEGIKFFIGHYAQRSWVGEINLHGHSHSKLEPFYNQLDVGVDNAYKQLGQYRPFTLDEVKEIVRTNNARIDEMPALYEGGR